MKNTASELVHLAKDWWQSRGEARKAPNGMARAIRDASFAGGSKGSVPPSEEILKQAAENHEQYNKSFDDE
jgi:hypothetical protein